MKEATARIKINRLLEAAGWRFFAEGTEPANIRLEPHVTAVRLAKLLSQDESRGKGRP
jgi:type I restriction enzyme R subunit